MKNVNTTKFQTHLVEKWPTNTKQENNNYTKHNSTMTYVNAMSTTNSYAKQHQNCFRNIISKGQIVKIMRNEDEFILLNKENQK